MCYASLLELPSDNTLPHRARFRNQLDCASGNFAVIVEGARLEDRTLQVTVGCPS